MMLRRLARGIGANAFGQLMSASIQLALVPIMATHWGLARYGLWLLIATIPTYLLVSDLGFAKAAGAEMNMKAAVGDQRGALVTFQSALAAVITLTIAITCLASLVCYLLPPGWLAGAGSTPPHEVRLAIWLMSLYGTLILSGTILAGGFQCGGHFAMESFSAALVWLFEATAAGVTVILGGDFVAVALAYVVARSIGLVAQWITMVRLVPFLSFGFAHVRWEEIKRLSTPAAAVMAIPTANALLLQMTTVAVGWAATAAAVPAFTTVRTICRLGLQLTSVVSRAVMPEFAAAEGRRDRALQFRLIVLVQSTGLMVLLPLAALLLAFGPQIVQLWTHQVVHPSRLLIALMVGMMLASGTWTPLATFLVAINRQSLFAYRFLGLCVLAVFIAYGAALVFGSAGGAIAMLFVDTTMLLLILRLMGDNLARPADIARAIPDAMRSYQSTMRGFATRQR